MITRRVLVNLGAFLAITSTLIYIGTTQLLLRENTGRSVNVEFSDASGLLPRDDVTMRGVPVGSVAGVTLTPGGTAVVKILLDQGVLVPEGTHAMVTRRSPIGDMVVELAPGRGSAMPSGGTIPVSMTQTAPDPGLTITVLRNLLRSIPSQDISTVVSQLATALRGRGQDLATLEVAGGQLPERLLQVRTQLDSLMHNGPKVLHALAINAPTLADDITQTYLLADILRDQRYNLLKLSKNGARFAQVANDLISSEKPNIACFIHDIGDVNSTIAEPNYLAGLSGTLDNNHFFFGGVQIAVVDGLDGLRWFRVSLEPPNTSGGRAYQPHRAPPDVYAANACQSLYGRGVGPGHQPGPLYLAVGSYLIPGH